jgi:hypothetical protein
MNGLRWILTLLLLGLMGGAGLAQEVTPEVTAEPTPLPPMAPGVLDAYFTSDTDAPRLGEPFTLTLVVDSPLGVTIDEFPELPADAPLAVLSTADVTEEVQGNRVIYRQPMQVVFWETGNYLSPELFVLFDAGNGLRSAPVTAISFAVPSMLGSDANPSARPDAPTIDLAYTPLWVYGVILTAAIVAVMLVVRLLQSGTRGLFSMGASTPAQIAIAQLEDLQAQNLPAVTAYPLVASQLRQYLHEQYGFQATEMTTAELIQALRAADLFETPRRRQLHQLLEQADLVKFARFQPDPAASRRLLHYAIRWLKADEMRLQRTGESDT